MSINGEKLQIYRAEVKRCYRFCFTAIGLSGVEGEKKKKWRLKLQSQQKWGGKYKRGRRRVGEKRNICIYSANTVSVCVVVGILEGRV